MDTIAAIATPPGAGAIGIVRVSGPAAADIALPLLSGLPPRQQMETHRLYPCRVCDPADGAVVDRILAVYMHSPHSYTGEDSIELHCHGGPTVVRIVQDLLVSQGARPAQPGEFTRRAFLNGKIDLAQAEAVIDMIESRSAAGLKLAARQLGGRLSAELHQITTSLRSVRALLEAAIDFPDDETDILQPQALAAQLQAACQQVCALAATHRSAEMLRNGLHVVIAGTPNSGKSTLLNALVGDDRAIVTDQPGTTRDMVRETLIIADIPVHVSDTAGIRASTDQVESLGIDRARTAVTQADIVLAVIDSARILGADDCRLLRAIANENVITVLSKDDLPLQTDIPTIRTLLPNAPLVAISAMQGTGMPELHDVLSQGIRQMIDITGTEVLLNNSRHKMALDNTAAALQQAAASLNHNRLPELVAIEVQEALTHLGAITGATTTDDILDLIFSRFCIGK